MLVSFDGRFIVIFDFPELFKKKKNSEKIGRKSEQQVSFSSFRWKIKMNVCKGN